MTIEVSNGKAPESDVPEVVGLSAGTARATLEDAGFVVEVRREQVKDKKDDGIVLAQIARRRRPGAEGHDGDDHGRRAEGRLSGVAGRVNRASRRAA